MRWLLQNCRSQLFFHTNTAPCIVRQASKSAQQQPKKEPTTTHEDAAKFEYTQDDTSKKRNNYGAKHCMSLVEKYDYENYLSTLLLPQELRRAAFALRALNVEISRSVGSHNIEPQIAKLRLKFWYDSIDKCFEAPSSKSYVEDQPVLRELKATVGTRKLNKLYLRRLILARERPLNQSFESIRQLEEYADHTCASLLHLLVDLADLRDLNVDHAASHLGKAQGIALMLRAIPHTGRQQSVGVPLEVLVRHGVSQERVLRSDAEDKGVEECIFEVASAANTHLNLARQLLPQMPRVARKLFLPAVATHSYLERLRHANFHLTNPRCLKRDTMLPVRLYWNLLLNKY